MSSNKTISLFFNMFIALGAILIAFFICAYAPTPAFFQSRGVPSCDNLKALDLPKVINDQWIDAGGTSSFDNFKFTDIVTISSNPKEGSRVCGASVMMSNEGKVFSNRIEYETKFTDPTRTYYIVKVYFQGEIE